jgi:transposase, IS5 family
MKRYPNSGRLGRHSTPVEVILRMLVVKRLYGWSYQQTERFVSDSIVVRQFCRLYLESTPDDTTLIRWANQIGPQTVASLNDRAVELARSLKVTRGRKLRVDSTVVETNVHHPTDSRLLGDGVRVVSRLLRRAREALGEEATRLGKEAFRTRNRSVMRLTKEFHRIALRKGEKAAEELKEAYRQLVRNTRASLAQAGRVAGALRERADVRSQRLADKLLSTSFPWSSRASTRRFAASSERSRSRLKRRS